MNLGEAPSRWSGEGQLMQESWDAAVVCADVNGGEGGSLSAFVDEFASRTKGRCPEYVVVAAKAMQEASSEKSLFGNFFQAAATEEGSFDVGSLSEAGAKRVAVVRHGELFGSDGLPAFQDGLKTVPTLSEDLSRRGARVGALRLGGKKTERGTALDAPTRRSALARVCAEAVLSRSAATGPLVELQVASLLGPEPTPQAWKSLVEEALKASDKRSALRLQTITTIDVPTLETWIFDQWGPTALRANSATYAATGARPVAFERVLKTTKKNKEDLAVLRYEDFDGTNINAAGSLVFSYFPDQQLLTVTRDQDDVLPGEVALMNNLADSVTQTFPQKEKTPVIPPKAPQEEVAAAAPDKEEKNEVEKAAAPKPTLKRRSAVRFSSSLTFIISKKNADSRSNDLGLWDRSQKGRRRHCITFGNKRTALLLLWASRKTKKHRP